MATKEKKESENTTVFESAMTLDKLIFSKKDQRWRAKIIVGRVDKVYDAIKTAITLNKKPYEEDIVRIEDQIAKAKREPDLFDSGDVKQLEKELKEEEKIMEKAIKDFGNIEFTAFIENLTQRNDGKTGLTLIVPKDIISEFMAKINHEQDNISNIEFYI